MDKKGFLGNRRDRALAIILSHKEKECDTYLPLEVSRGLRQVILDEFNDVMELAFDLIDDDIIINEEFLDKLDEVLEKRFELD